MRLASILFAVVVLALLGPSPLRAQSSSGQVQGVVSDSASGEALAGANVRLEGTGLGASTTPEGKYVITRIPPGTYTLSVKYIGYVSKHIAIEVKAGEDITRNFSLTPEVLEGETIVVTAQARGQKEAINLQLSSNTITNVVSAEKIHELPDANAATALSRLPGVSLMNGDQVVIRGMQAKLNTVLINGVQIPSTDMNDRSTNLGFISSNLLSGIEVTKALTPDMDANAIGGVVNLKIREASADWHSDVFLQGAYNNQDKVYDHYKFWASVSNRFFDDNLGVFIQGNADRFDIGEDIGQATFGINGTGSIPYGEAPYQMNSFTFQDQWNVVSNGGASLILDYRLPHGKIVFQNTYASTLSDNTTFRNTLNFDVTRIDYSIFRDKYGKDLMINALQGEYTFGDIKTELTVSHSYTDKYTRTRYGDPGNFFGFQNQRDVHPFGVDSAGRAIQYLNERQYFTPADVYGIPIDPTDAYNAQVSGWVISRAETFDQHVYHSALDVTVPLTFSEDVSTKIKLGGKFARSTRMNDVEATFKGSNDPDYYLGTTNYFPGHTGLSTTNPVMFTDLWDQGYSRGDYFLESTYPFEYAYQRDLMDDYMETSIDGWLVSRHTPSSERDDFKGAEEFGAAYLMGTFDFGPQLSLIAGARFEHYNMDYRAKFVYVTHSVYGYANIYDTLNTVDRSDDNVFPNVQVRYKVNDWSDVRLAYTQGISRPDFRAILPNTYFEPGASAQAGNTQLKPSISTNYDAYVSLYNNDIGLITVGGFYKNIENTFFQTSIFYQNLEYYDVSFPDSVTWAALGIVPAGMPSPSQTISTYVNNPDPAHVSGFEVEWQTNFWYLPGFLSSLVLTANYTKAWSDMDYQQIRNIDSTYPDPVNPRIIRHKYITSDTVRNARLLYQSNDVVNVALGIDYKGFSGRLSFNLRGNVITTVGARPEEDQFTGNIIRWDLTLQQELPLEGLKISFDGVNIFHNPTETFRNFRRSSGGTILENLASTAYAPTMYQLSLRYGF